MLKPHRLALLAAVVATLGGCDRMSRATPQDRVGYLRELVRARTVARERLPIDGCSVTRFMEGVPAWRDSLAPAERSVIADVTPCGPEGKAVAGRFVLTEWHKNWSGEYVIRGTTLPFDLGYRFTDGIFVGRETLENQAYFAGIAERKAVADSLAQPLQDSVRRAGMLGDTLSAVPLGDTTRPRE